MALMSDQITFVLFVFNEEQRIERAIRNFQGYGRILIVDNESTDRTRDIALHHGCSILIHKNAGWVEDEVTTRRVKDVVVTPWIYWGFADELVEAWAMESILSVVHAGRYDIVSVVRKNYYYGEFCNNLFATRTNRIFRKDAIDFRDNMIHHFGRVVEGARIYNLSSEHFVHHFISNTAKSYLDVLNRYTDTESMEARPVPGIPHLLLSTAKILCIDVVMRRGYRGGKSAVFLVAHMIYYRWISAMKLYETAAGLDREAIERKNDVIRDAILHLVRQANETDGEIHAGCSTGSDTITR